MADRIEKKPIDWLGWIRASVPILVIFSSIIISYNKVLTLSENNKVDIMIIKEDVETLKEANKALFELNKKIENIDNKLDTTLRNYPWNKVDDYYFMLDYSRTNELNMPEHRRVLPDENK